MRRVGPMLLLAIGVLMTAWPAWGAGRLAATGVRIGVAGQATEVGIAFSGTPRYRAFTLVGPDRVVVDLDEVDFRLTESVRAGGGPIKAMRFGLFQPGTSRMVLDMASPYAIESASLSPQSG